MSNLFRETAKRLWGFSFYSSFQHLSPAFHSLPWVITWLPLLRSYLLWNKRTPPKKSCSQIGPLSNSLSIEALIGSALAKNMGELEPGEVSQEASYRVHAVSSPAMETAPNTVPTHQDTYFLNFTNFSLCFTTFISLPSPYFYHIRAITYRYTVTQEESSSRNSMWFYRNRREKERIF